MDLIRLQQQNKVSFFFLATDFLVTLLKDYVIMWVVKVKIKHEVSAWISPVVQLDGFFSLSACLSLSLVVIDFGSEQSSRIL